MNRRSGFSLIGLVLSLGLFSVLLNVFLKLNAWEHGRSQAILEEQNLMAYVDVLHWSLKREDGPKNGFWSGFQDPKTRERKFVRGVTNERVCLAKVTKEEEGIYRVVLRGENLKKTIPMEFFSVN